MTKREILHVRTCGIEELPLQEKFIAGRGEGKKFKRHVHSYVALFLKNISTLLPCVV